MLYRVRVSDRRFEQGDIYDLNLNHLEHGIYICVDFDIKVSVPYDKITGGWALDRFDYIDYMEFFYAL